MRLRTQAPRSLVQAGFTLIELIVVIVIIGILAAVAIPKFQDLTTSAEKAVVKGMAAELGTAAAMYYAKQKADSATYPGSMTCSGLNASTDYMASPIDTAKYSVSGNLDSAGCTVALLVNNVASTTITWTTKVPY